MAASVAGSSHPGLSVGPTSEFSLFFQVKPGEGPSLRSALLELQDTPGYRPGDYGMAIQTIHEARFVLFDDDTRLAFITSFDGPWDAYMEDFFTSGPTLALFDVIFRHVEGYDGLPDLARRQGVRPGCRADRSGVRPQLRRHGQGDPEGPARQRGLPAGSRPSRRPPSSSSIRRCSRCSTRPATSRRPANRGRDVACRTTSPGRAPWPTRSRTSPTSTRSRAPSRRSRLVLVMNTLPMAKPSDLFSDGLLYRFRLRPLTRPPPTAPGWPFVPGRRGARPRLRLLRPGRRRWTSRAQEGTCTSATGESVSFRVERPAGRLRCRASASSPASAGIRSSWTPAPR